MDGVTQKIQLLDICNSMDDGQKLKSDNDFIKMCKGIYKFTYSLLSNDKDRSNICIAGFNHLVMNFCHWLESGQEKNLSYVLANIGKIQCDDEEFKGFQQAIKNCIFVFDAETKKFKVKYDDELDLDIGDDNSIIETTEEKISAKKLFF